MTREEFEKLIKNEKFVLVDFYATWCMPCKMQSEIISDLNDVYGLTIKKIDVDKNEDLVKEFNIVSVPTLIMFKQGEIVKRYVGVAKATDIKSWMK